MNTPRDGRHGGDDESSRIAAPAGAELRQARKRPAWQLITLIVVAIASTLAILELALRTGGVGPSPVWLVDDARCYYVFPPNAHQQRHKPGTPLRFDLRTDDRGFRSQGHANPLAPAGPVPPRCQVLYVGDSYVQGSWVADDQTAPAQLAAMLLSSGYRTAVFNGGVEGHTIAQARMGVLGIWKDLAGGVTVVQRTANDLDDLIALRRLGCDWKAEAPTALTPAIRGPVGSLAMTSVAQDSAARLVSISRRLHAVEANQGALDGAAAPLATLAECTQAAQDYVTQSLALVHGVRSMGGQVLFVGVGTVDCRTKPNEPPFDSRGWVAAWARQVHGAGGRVLEAPDLLSAPGATLEPWDGHPSAAGQRAIATAVHGQLLAQGWLDGCRKP